MDKSYLEIKVSFIHIVILLVGVVIIGVFLFYLGYQAGKSSAQNKLMQAGLTEDSGKTEEIQLTDDTVAQSEEPPAPREPSISDEIKLHQLPTSGRNVQKEKERIKPKPLTKSSYYSVQVGAFSDYSNAKNYAARFTEIGYQTEINPTVQRNKKLYRVRVGSFQTRDEAKREKQKLEKRENRKFAIVKSQ